MTRRAFGAVFGSVAVSTTGFLASNTVNGLVAEDLTGHATWTGLPAAATVLGTAAGATALAALVRRRGARTGLALGYLLAAVAITTAIGAILTQQFLTFVVALFFFGAGFGSNRLARYVVADLYSADRRATMIGWIVWASTIGAVAGPSLLGPSTHLAHWLQINTLAGPLVACLVACVVSAAIMFTAPTAMDAATREAARPQSLVPLRELLVVPGVRLALLVMVIGQFVMVLLMTMTPLHLRHEGHELSAIGGVISAHTLGMFAFSPITGRIGDRYGRFALLWTGLALLVLACLIGALGDGSYLWMTVSLFLLGLGWNFGFVGGSALLTDSTAPEHRVRVQGAGDSLIWGGSAIASLSSGWLLARTGFPALSLVGLGLSLIPVWTLVRARTPTSPPRPV
ncbi:MAG: MFS transporter [Vicinamibacterales bacterium]